jgi:alkylation response protein AidB-like acyl-CoA dehydrogenase
LSGQLVAVPFAAEVDRLVVWASSDPGTGVFLVDPEAEGVTLTPTVSTAGEREFAVSLDGVLVEGADVVVPPAARGLRAARRLYQHLLVGLAAEQLGLAEAALDMTARYVSTRKQFGQPIGAFQAVSARAADAFIDLTAMRWTMYRAAEAVYDAEDAAAEVAVAKFWAAEGGGRVLATAVHLHGGLGVDTTYPLHRYFLRAKRLEVMLGGAGTQLARLWDALTRQEAVVE